VNKLEISQMAERNLELVKEILRLKRQRNAIILAHNYQRGEVQDLADFVGGSLELSQNASKAEAEVIVFGGVHFMAETASILCPEKTVLLPDIAAGCPMANMITAERLVAKKKEVPDAAVVCYINSSADVKAESDVCCTSANAVKVIESLDTNKILFVPDQHLGHYVSTKIDKEMILWPGFCPTHVKIQAEDVINQKREHPGAKVIVHPECRPDVIALADEVLSTGGMCRFAKQTDARVIIVGTEVGVIHRLSKENPDKKFIAASQKAVCPNMKKITAEKVLWALQDMAPEVRVAEEIRVRAKRAVDRMLDIGSVDTKIVSLG
jgi:quinolinate synthase